MISWEDNVQIKVISYNPLSINSPVDSNLHHVVWGDLVLTEGETVKNMKTKHIRQNWLRLKLSWIKTYSTLK